MAIDDSGPNRIALTVPAGAVVKVISGPKNGDRLIDVLWDGRVVTMFAVDLQQRGDAVDERAAEG